jgi:hypothetical protein
VKGRPSKPIIPNKTKKGEEVRDNLGPGTMVLKVIRGNLTFILVEGVM